MPTRRDIFIGAVVAVGVGQHKWTEYVISIDDIERQTGYEFLSNVPEGVRKAVETRVAEGL